MSDNKTLLIKPITEVVECFRAGSGDFTVRAPSEDWVENTKKVAAHNYGRATIVVRTEYITGYNGYPGCHLWFYPGDAKGLLEEDLLWSQPPASLAKSIDNGGAFGISTSIDEIIALRDVLNKAIENMRARQKK